MRLKSLGAQYFMGFGEWNVIHFEENQQIVSIIGQWESEPKRSNRSGKSTLVEVILYCLYGKSRSKKEIELINKSFPEEDMITELTFENDKGEEIKIQRGRTANNSIILELSGFEGADKKVVQDEIDRIIGLDYNDFIMTSFFIQGDIHTFMQAGSTGQKQIISKWLEKEYWKEYEKKSKEKQSIVQKEIDSLRYAADDKPDLSEDEKLKNGINIYEGKMEHVEEELGRLNNKLDGIKGDIKKATEIAGLRKEIKRVERNITNYQDEIDELKKDEAKQLKELPLAEQRGIELQKLDWAKEQVEEINFYIANKQEEIYTVTNLSGELKAQRSNLLETYNQMDGFNAICPVMNKACTAIESIEGAKEDVVAKGKTLKKQIKELKEQHDALKEEMIFLKGGHLKKYDYYKEILSYRKLPSVEDINQAVEEITNNINNKLDKIKELTKEHQEKSKTLSELENIDIDSLKDLKVETNNEIRVKNSERDDIINNVATFKATLEQNKKRRKKAIQASKEIKALTEKLNHYKMVTFMFSKNGIPSNQVEVAFQELEDEANIILQTLAPDITIEFSPDKEMKTWEENCLVCNNPFPKGYRRIDCPECGNDRQKKRKDELSITIKTRNDEMDFNLESGGGKVLISLAIRLSFVRLLQRRLGTSLKLIVLDEVFGMLDEVNRDLVFKLLTTTLIQEFGFSQIFCISHEEEIRDVIPDVIKVTKYDDWSEFSWE